MHRLIDNLGRSLIFILVLFLHVSINSYADESPVAASNSDVQEPKSDYIKVSDIPEEAAKALLEIKRLSEILAEDKEISETYASLESYAQAIDVMLDDPVNKYLEYIPLRDLMKKESEWNVYINQLTTWNTILKDRISVFDENRKILENLSNLWSNTHIHANKELAPQAILDHISSVIIEIEKLRNYAKNRYDMLLTASNIITTKLLAISDLEKRTKEAIENVSNRLFYQNGLPLNILFHEQSFSPVEYFVSAYNSLIEKMNEFVIYYRNQNRYEVLIFSGISLMIILFVAFFNHLYRKKRLFVHAESYDKREYRFITLPFSTSLAMMMLANVFVFEDIPLSAKQFQMLFLLFPIFRIFQTLVSKRALNCFYIYFSLYFLSIVEDNATGYELDGRVFSLILSASLAVFIYYMVKNRLFDDFVKPFLLKYVYKILSVSILFLVISIGADIYGATLLASRITSSIFVSLYSSIIFYVLTTVLAGYIIILLRRRISSASNMLEQFSRKIERTTVILIKIMMTFWWFIVLTKAIGINSYIVAAKNDLLSLSWVIGNTTISVQSIFDFIIIILGTWFLAKLTRVVLEVEVFSRYKFPRGFPTAITTILNYVIVISGTFIALSSLGITSDQFALVFGALGVGIGFGMRNIVANFISGIIMVFERPIQIGDTIEINNTMGKVQGIGTRSSTIKTFDGSEVIIPNADFIAKEITNWTLSDERRRKTLVFKVAQNSDIHQVLSIMDSVASSHPNVLTDPKPMATFVNFGEYYLEFKLYFWLHENLIMAQSDITIGIYETLQEAGIKMPLPKQEFIKNAQVIEGE